MHPAPDWSAQQLADPHAAVSAAADEGAAIEQAVACAAAAVDAEIGALVCDGRVVCSLGFPSGTAVDDVLAAAAAAGAGEHDMEILGVGPCAVLVIALESTEPTSLVLVRVSRPFTRQEADLVHGMCRVLSLTLRMYHALAEERSLREASELQSAQLRERELLFEQLFDIQRLISGRAPVQVVFDAIVKATARLFDDEVVGLRLVDEDDPSFVQLVATVGVSEEALATTRRTRVGHGVGGRVIAEGRLIVADDYVSYAHPLQAFVDEALCSAMGAPVTRDGAVVGCLVVASRRSGRTYGERDQDMLRAFAEHVSFALNDASARQAIDKALLDAVHDATHDSLTGLPNRAHVVEGLDQALARTSRSGRGLGVLFIDIDRFKLVNDSLGHGVGDDTLIEIARRLTEAARTGDTVGRLSGDEFVVICEDIGLDEALDLAERLAAVIAGPINLYGRETVLTASVGVSHMTTGGDADEVLRDADVAMYRAKERGRARIELFDNAMRTRILERIETEHALRRAIHTGGLRVHYQPIFSLATGRPVSVEALVRWQLPDGRLVPPDEFVPLAEDAGLIVPIGAWVLMQACIDLAGWRRDHPPSAGLSVAINLSARQIGDPGLSDLVADALRGSGLPGDALVLEITESVLMVDAETTIQTLRSLESLGVRLAIDHFGTGYSSLSHLRRFRVDALKIDRSFLDGLETGEEDSAIVSAVVGLAAVLGLDVVAEGVETDGQLRELRRLGCQLAQGFLLGRPMPAHDILTVLDEGAVGDGRLVVSAPRG